jgi:SOS response regulatory protein OraA/RecX
VPTVTALRARGPGRVAVELDGAPWRVLPVDVVARTGIGEGRVLDRPALRLLRRELRRTEALRAAAGALRYRDLSSRRLAERLARKDVTPREAGETLETLARAGLVDDARFARNRAERLAERGYGDAAIRHRLAADGLPPEPVAEALAGLAGEAERAQRIVRDRGTGVRTARYLSARGFGEEAVEAALGAGFGHEG